jgi:hypothetical protein
MDGSDFIKFLGINQAQNAPFFKSPGRTESIGGSPFLLWIGEMFSMGKGGND